MCPDWGRALYIHPQQHSSRWDHTKALQGLTALTNELVRNSGINDPLTNWLKQLFGKWKGVMTSILTSLVVVFGAMALFGCPLYMGINF
jgi:hypothetical protein